MVFARVIAMESKHGFHSISRLPLTPYALLLLLPFSPILPRLVLSVCQFRYQLALSSVNTLMAVPLPLATMKWLVSPQVFTLIHTLTVSNANPYQLLKNQMVSIGIISVIRSSQT